MARASRKRSKPLTLPEITLTPLIDTALVLLVIFMVATPIVHNAIKVQLPHGKSNEVTSTQQDLIVYLDKDRNIFVNEQAVKKENLFGILEKKMKDGAGQTVFVKADQSIAYGTVVELVDEIKYVGGVNYVALATQKSVNRSVATGAA